MNWRGWLRRLVRRTKRSRRENPALATPPSPKPSTLVRPIAPDSSATPQSQVPREKQPKVVVVGIDFGTSGTKIVLGDAIAQRHYLLAPSRRSRRDPSFVFPSVVRLKGGRVFFCAADGDGAGDGEQRADAEFDSFKVCLACQHGLASCRGCAHRGESPGVFSLPGVCGADRLEAEHLATWFLAYVIGHAKRELARRWGASFLVEPIFNIGAPIDQWNAPKGLELFTRVAFYGEKLSGVISDGAQVADLLGADRRVRAQYPLIPPESDRVIFVQPETAAGLMSFVTSLRAPAGLYGIVDVGAGTTDVSFFRLADLRPYEPRRMSFYEAKTDVVGAGDLDRDLARLILSRLPRTFDKPVAANSPAVLAAARLAKETLGLTGGCEIRLSAGSVKLAGSDVQKSFQPTIRQMLQTYIHTNHLAYQKEKLVTRWRAFTILTLGGGTKCPPVYKALRATRPSRYNENIKFDRIPVPADFECEASERGSFELAAVAYGLSFPPPDFPEILRPRAVAPMEIILPRKRRPDRDDLYAK